MLVQLPTFAAAGLALAALTQAAPSCGTYTLISTRGTQEPQGPSRGFTGMINSTLTRVPGGVEYDTVYPAALDQQSGPGTDDIINKITTTLSSCPDHKFALFGYSQGATATTMALPKLTGKAYDAVISVILLGNPMHRPGLKSNQDLNGGNSTENSKGLLSYLGGIPSDWDASGKVIDFCAKGDGVCDVEGGIGITAEHLYYVDSAFVQDSGAVHVIRGLQAGGGSSSSSSSSAATSASQTSASGATSTGAATPTTDSGATAATATASSRPDSAASLAFGRGLLILSALSAVALAAF